MRAGEQRSRPRAAEEVRAAGRRAWEALPAASQLAVAATASYSFAHFVLGHPVPLLAITVCLSSLGFVRDARPRRVLETASGLAVGVALAEVMLLVAGRGPWQIAVAIFATLLLARVLKAAPAVAVAATAQSAIVLLIQLPAGGTWARSIDGFVGGGVALVATALLPRDPRHAAQRDADRVFADVRRAVDDTARALRLADRAAASGALQRLRALEPLLADWRTTVDSAVAIAKVSPFLHRRLAELQDQRRLHDGTELAIRGLRIIVRRAEALVADGRRRPEVAELLQAVGSALDLMARSVREPSLAATAREDLELIAGGLDPRLLSPSASMTEATLVVLVRPVVVDLAVATGADREAVRATLPDLG